jgi:hypothetical protein
MALSRFETVFTGMNVNNVQEKLHLMKEMCSGEAKTALESGVAASIAAQHLQLQNLAIANVGQQDVANNETLNEWRQRQASNAATGAVLPPMNELYVLKGLQAILAAVCPSRTLENQKRFIEQPVIQTEPFLTGQYISGQSSLS